MVRSETRLRVLTLGVTVMLAVGACGGSTTTPSPAAPTSGATTPPSGTSQPSAQPSPSEANLSGGTLYMLQSGNLWNHVDPQRAYTGEDLAFFGATIYRGLEAYQYSTDAATATGLVPDLATDTGTASADAKTWSFTLKDGVKFQDGSPITCEDVKYGVSRTFATDIITDGPTYQIQYLDIPTVDGYTKDKDGKPQATTVSTYGGPYSDTLPGPVYTDKTLTTEIPNDKAAYDKAVTCDGSTITFHLNAPIGDFNYATTLGFTPVPKAADTGENYGSQAPFPVSSGPYMIQSYTTGAGGKMVLVRNPNWDPATDPIRKAYPDKWEIDFGIDSKVIDQRLIQSTGNDAYAMLYGNPQTENLPTLFVDPNTPQPGFEGRVVSAYDIYALYYHIDTTKVSNLKIREAMAVALDRSAIRKNAGGAFAGDLGDGVIKPNLGTDYAPTGMWTDMFGAAVPDTGNVDLAKQLIADSGEAAPTITFDFADTPTREKEAAIVKSSLERAGFTVNLNPLERGSYYSVIFDPKKENDFGWNGWGYDWPNASTIIPPLFTPSGGWDLSRVDDPAWLAKVAAAKAETDRPTQGQMWQDLNKEAMQNVYAIPTLFDQSQLLAGTSVGGVYSWAPYGSFPYGVMYVKP